MKKLIGLLLLASITGCTVIKAPTVYKEETDSNFTEQTKDIGQNLVSFTIGTYSNAIIIDKTPQPESKNLKNTTNPSGVFFKKGDVLIHHTSIGKTNYYFPENSINNAGVSESLFGIAMDYNSNEALLYIHNGISWTYARLKEPLEYTPTTRPSKTENYFEKNFLYNGKSGNIIKFTYREFSNSVARPAFTQDIQYDLNESNIIGFQNMRMEIINTSNTSITYKIIKGFTKE